MVARVLPQQAYLREALSYDPISGRLTWSKRPRHHFATDKEWRRWNVRHAGTEAGTVMQCTCGPRYRVIALKGVRYLAHRIIWKMMTGAEPGPEIDHATCNGLDNRWVKLREATYGQNAHNSPRSARDGAKGVGRHHNGWRARIRVNGVLFHLGTFASEAEAQRAYATAAKRAYGEFANIG